MSHTKRCSQRPTLREEQAYLFLCLSLLGVAISLQSIGYLSVLAGSMIGWLLYRSEAKRGHRQAVTHLVGLHYPLHPSDRNRQ